MLQHRGGREENSIVVPGGKVLLLLLYKGRTEIGIGGFMALYMMYQRIFKLTLYVLLFDTVFNV